MSLWGPGHQPAKNPLARDMGLGNRRDANPVSRDDTFQQTSLLHPLGPAPPCPGVAV